MNRKRLVEMWRREEAQPFRGWDFSYLEGRMVEGRLPWDYMVWAAALMERSSSAVDMGTGGGERLLELREHWPKRMVVTEGYAPNVELAKQRLAPLGVEVVEVETNGEDAMPFTDGEFELVLNRHSGFNPAEVARILAAGGTFLTQQVDGRWGWDLMAVFGAETQFPESTLAHDVPKLEAAGLTMVTAREWSGAFSFSDVGAIVYYLKAIPWLVPGFSVDTYLEGLFELQRRLEAGEGLDFWAGQYLIEARK